jgi:hypothetical protein
MQTLMKEIKLLGCRFKKTPLYKKRNIRLLHIVTGANCSNQHPEAAKI